jgi:hypothetical protein
MIRAISGLTLVVICVARLLGVTASLAADCDAQNPTFSLPGPNAASGASLSGIWAGDWEFQGMRKTRVVQCARIHVSVMDNQAAVVAYCSGSRSDVGTLPQCDKYDAKVSGDSLSFVTHGGFTIVLKSNGEIESSTGTGGKSLQTSFHKQ